MGIKLAEALLRRKELADKIKVASAIKASGLFEQKVIRKNVTENIDEIQMQIPKLTLSQVTAEFDFYSKQMRLLDAAIQQANWTTELGINGSDVLTDYADAQKDKA